MFHEWLLCTFFLRRGAPAFVIAALVATDDALDSLCIWLRSIAEPWRTREPREAALVSEAFELFRSLVFCLLRLDSTYISIQYWFMSCNVIYHINYEYMPDLSIAWNKHRLKSIQYCTMLMERILICVSSRTRVFGARCIIPKKQWEDAYREEDVPMLQLLQCVHLKLDHDR